jgi:hypothetical protein
MSVAQIQEAVAGLRAEERAELAAWLLDSLPPATEDDAGADSVEEAARRRAELDSGQVVAIPSEEFWSRIDQARRQWE